MLFLSSSKKHGMQRSLYFYAELSISYTIKILAENYWFSQSRSCSMQLESALISFMLLVLIFENVLSTSAVLWGRVVVSSINLAKFAYAGNLRIPCQSCSATVSSNHHQYATRTCPRLYSSRLRPHTDCTEVACSFIDGNTLSSIRITSFLLSLSILIFF